MKMRIISSLILFFSFTFLKAQSNNGAELIKNKEYKSAIEYYDSIIPLDNDYSNYYNRGVSHLYLKNFTKAKDDFTTCITLSPKDTSCLFGLGVVNADINEPEKSLKYLLLAKDAGKSMDFTLSYKIGTAFLWNNNPDSALKYLMVSYDINPVNQHLLTNLGFSNLESNPQESCKYFKEAYNLDSLDDRTINNLGYSHYLCGNLTDAITFYNKALESNPKNGYIYRNIGLYYKVKEDKLNACINLNKALDNHFIEKWGKEDLKELTDYCN